MYDSYYGCDNTTIYYQYRDTKPTGTDLCNFFYQNYFHWACFVRFQCRNCNKMYMRSYQPLIKNVKLTIMTWWQGLQHQKNSMKQKRQMDHHGQEEKFAMLISTSISTFTSPSMLKPISKSTSNLKSIFKLKSISKSM